MVTISEPAGPGVFTLRRCGLLCLPALVLGAVLRLSFLLAVPQAYYGTDSGSYFTTAYHLWEKKHRFDLPPKRRYLYPLFEAVLPALPGSPAVWTAVLQHAVGLATVAGIGWITGQLTSRPGWWVPPVTLAAAVWPRMLWYEHEMIAESLVLGAFVLAVALALPIRRLQTGRGLFWFMMATATLIALKPHGRPLCLALLAVAGVHAWRKVRPGLPHYAALALIFALFVSAGSSSQGSWLLLSSTLPLLKTEGAKWAEYRAVLRPLVQEVAADLPNYPLHQFKYKKRLNDREELGPVWGDLVRDKERYGQVASGLAMEGILAHPVAYAGLIFGKVVLSMSSGEAAASIPPAVFWARQATSSEGRWENGPAEARLVYHMDEADYRRLVEKGRTRRLWFEPWLPALGRAATWTKYYPGLPTVPPTYRFTWLGGLACFGLLTCLWPGRFWITALIWAPPLFYYAVIYGVGDAVVRYLHPADWCWLVVIALGGDFVCDRFVALRRRPLLAA